MRKYIITLTVAVALLACPARSAFSEVVIKVRALNPMNTKETAKIDYPLPHEIAEAHILKKKINYSMDHSEDEEPPKQEFNIVKDDKLGGFHVRDEIVLLPKEVVTLEVHVQDVWQVSLSKIEALKAEVDTILQEWEEDVKASENEGADETEQASRDETREFALVMKKEIIDALDSIVSSQDKSKIIKVGVENHIAAFQENVEVLRQVQQDVVLLANLIQFDLEAEEAEEGEVTEDADDADISESPDDQAAVDQGTEAAEEPSQEVDMNGQTEGTDPAELADG